jgi:hypothetical protein
VRCSVLFCCALVYSVLNYCTLLCSALTLPYSAVLCPAVLCCALFYSTLLYCVLLYSAPLCSILLYSTLLCCDLYCPVLPYSTVLGCTLLYFGLRCSVLPYSTLLCYVVFHLKSVSLDCCVSIVNYMFGCSLSLTENTVSIAVFGISSLPSVLPRT